MIEKYLTLLQEIPEFNNNIQAGLIIFSRFIGFVKYAPVLNRKDIPIMIKTAFALIMTVSFVIILQPEKLPEGSSLFLAILLNLIFGVFIGYLAQVIFSVAVAAGDIINMQMGLSSAMMFDQSAKEQSSLVGRFFRFFATIIFIHVGGVYWLFLAFDRTFEIFPIYSTSFMLYEEFHIDYLIKLTGNILTVGLQIASPVLLTTLCQDVVLGTISKTAPQVNVFQLSFIFKPAVGAFVILFTVRTLANVIADYYVYYQKIF